MNFSRMHHRFFGFVRAVVLFLAVPTVLASCAGSQEGLALRDEPVRRTGFWLGTVISISVYHDVDEGVLSSFFDRIKTIEDQMSLQQEDSVMNEVNRQAGIAPVEVPTDFLTVARAALDMARRSDGAFEPSIGPLVKAWDITGNARVPSAEERERLRALVDWRKIRLDEEKKTLYLQEPGMALDMGGIAKGYAADEVARVAREAGIRSALLDLGGNIYVIGNKPNGQPWRIGVQNPDATRGDVIGLVPLTDGTMVSSGTYERFFYQDGVKYHHLLDPATGMPAEHDLDQVTIVSTRTSMYSDALSTACFVLGLEKGMALLATMDGYEGVFVTKDRRVWITPGLKDRYQVLDEHYPLAN